MPAYAPLPERFWPKVDRSQGDGACWPWLAYVSKRGYGWFNTGRVDGRAVIKPAHVVAFELCVGPVPEGCELDHVVRRGCTSKSCVNPAHLEPVTHAENVRRGKVRDYNLAKTHCPQGHPYDEQNTYRYRGGRSCKTCKNQRCLSRYHARKHFN